MAQTPNQPTSVDAFRNFEEEASQRGSNWGPMEPSHSSSSGLGGMKDSLAALYRPPFVLMFQGTFEQVFCASVNSIANGSVLQMSETEEGLSRPLLFVILSPNEWRGCAGQSRGCKAGEMVAC